MPSRLPLSTLALAAFLACSGAQAQTSQEVVITGSIVERTIADAPYAISVVGRDELRSAGPLVNLSEAVARVPGLVVANRWNFAQDLQISSRGFGARAGFGVRGVRLYSDGIPASGPDGQGQVSHFDLANAERVEVLRGPFSVLYGNSSGGVISAVSSTPRAQRFEAAVDAGSFGLRQLRLQGETPLAGGFDLRVAAAALEVDGFRPHSEAKRNLVTLRAGYNAGADSAVLQASVLDQPAQDPLGLDLNQFRTDPRGVASVAEQFNTRKTTRQSQLGLRWKHRFDAGALRDGEIALYGGQRDIVQFLAIPATTQGAIETILLANPAPGSARHGGGVIAFDRTYGGAEGRLRFAWDSVDLQAGVALDRQRDERKGYQNFSGTAAAPQQLGQMGPLRRDETNRARSDDVFAQAEWAFMPQLAAIAGVRAGRVELESVDAFELRCNRAVTPNTGNCDDSGKREFDYTNPVLGLRWAAAPGLKLYASVARGFESPTLGELAYRRDGTGGFNTELLPQRSRQFEIGAKWRGGALQADLTLFQAKVDDEISVATNAGGRSAFQNVGRTERQGAELSGRWQITPALSAALAATWLEATYKDSFLVCAGIPCNAPTLPVAAGNRIAGTQRSAGFAELAWRTAALGELALELRGAGDTVVNDRNTEAAPGYGLVGLRWAYGFQAGSLGKAELLLRVDNATDRRYAGSVIVNDANGRFYETGAPRSVLLALRFVMP
ncbi:Iron complex outermembrane receptor protein [Rubrivivax sp. A210]|uniref:TonB-dependent receptor family protein n=1 Tax=Rubrivivax sp. A210 TaxID=2772301 RepID=UPI00199E12C9|nr:TonB-dependent receptor [Rubrivivax sp. A210]CAD5374777.1 Iron complex outermembrane receptor protein [Rubrivivax sp. A210]